MFKERLKNETPGIDIGDTAQPLDLKTADGALLYHFPTDVIQAHRHMITRLTQANAMPTRLAIVAALRGEGVTYSSLAMAATLSHDFSHSVCYVDLNWWWPAPTMRKLQHQGAGIAAVLRQEATFEEIVVRTGLVNLDLVPAGELPPPERHVVARSEALVQLIDRLGERFDKVILDIPAILATSDAMVLASLGSACLLVVRQGVSPSTPIKQALDDIAHLPITGVLLNRVRVATPSWVRNWLPEQ